MAAEFPKDESEPMPQESEGWHHVGEWGAEGQEFASYKRVNPTTGAEERMDVPLDRHRAWQAFKAEPAPELPIAPAAVSSEISGATVTPPNAEKILGDILKATEPESLPKMPTVDWSRPRELAAEAPMFPEIDKREVKLDVRAATPDTKPDTKTGTKPDTLPKMDELLHKVQEAAKNGDSKEYVALMNQLMKGLVKEAEKGGIDTEALTPKKPEKHVVTKEQKDQAAKDMVQIHNIEELRDKLGRTGAKRDELINHHLRIGSPLEASDSVKKFVETMLDMPKAQFEMLRNQFEAADKAEKAKRDEEAAKKVSGNVELSAEFQVPKSNGLGEFDGGYKINADKIVIKDGQTFVTLEKTVEVENDRTERFDHEAFKKGAKGEKTQKPETRQETLTREVPITTLLMWQEKAKEAAPKTEEEAADETTKVMADMVNPNDPVARKESKRRVREIREIKYHRRLQERHDREAKKLINRLKAFREKAKKITPGEVMRRETARRLVGMTALAAMYGGRVPEIAPAP